MKSWLQWKLRLVRDESESEPELEPVPLPQPEETRHPEPTVPDPVTKYLADWRDYMNMAAKAAAKGQWEGVRYWKCQAEASLKCAVALEELRIKVLEERAA
jgi:hypothetical protein